MQSVAILSMNVRNKSFINYSTKVFSLFSALLASDVNIDYLQCFDYEELYLSIILRIIQFCQKILHTPLADTGNRGTRQQLSNHWPASKKTF